MFLGNGFKIMMNSFILSENIKQKQVWRIRCVYYSNEKFGDIFLIINSTLIYSWNLKVIYITQHREIREYFPNNKLDIYIFLEFKSNLCNSALTILFFLTWLGK